MIADGWREVKPGKWRKSHGRVDGSGSDSGGMNAFVRREQDFQTPDMDQPMKLSSNKDIRRDQVKRHMEKHYPSWVNSGYEILD